MPHISSLTPRTNPRDWRKFAKFDKYKYTRNLVHEGNGKFNLMLLCWAEGNQVRTEIGSVQFSVVRL